MRKLAFLLPVLGLFLLGTSSESQAQKFEGGDLNLELQASSPFNGSGSTFSISGIRGRYFMSDNSALRVNLGLMYNSNSTITQQSGDDQEQLQTTTNVFNIDLRPGYEYHFSGTDRLSPYFGGGLIFEMQSTSEVTEVEDGDNVEEWTVKNGQIQAGGQTLGPNQNGFTDLGLEGVAGVDYYFAESLYIGAELSLGLVYTMNSAVSVEYTGDASNLPDDQEVGNNFNLGTNAMGNFRVGFVF